MKDEQKNLLKKSLSLLNWTADHALETGILAEQVHPYSNEPLSVSPLTWSHATYVLAMIEYMEAYAEINRCEKCGQKLPFKQNHNHLTRKKET